MAPIQPAGLRAQREVYTKLATDVAVLVLIFGAMMSAWAMVVAATIGLLGLILYAFLSGDVSRHRYVLLALGAAIVAGTVAAGMGLLR